MCFLGVVSAKRMSVALACRVVGNINKILLAAFMAWGYGYFNSKFMKTRTKLWPAKSTKITGGCAGTSCIFIPKSLML
jgi:hypothetical protein